MNKETEKILDEVENFLPEEDSDKKELEGYRLEKEIKKNLEDEFKTLFEIFPNLDVDEIPDEVLERCESGKGLAGEYALYYMREEKKRAEQKEKEEENLKSAPPDVKNSSEELYFTPDDVRGMSRSEIRSNYKNIMKSMERWK